MRGAPLEKMLTINMQDSVLWQALNEYDILATKSPNKGL